MSDMGTHGDVPEARRQARKLIFPIREISSHFATCSGDLRMSILPCLFGFKTFD